MTKLKEIRERCGISQSKLAEMTGIPLRTICRWECEGVPTVEKIGVLAAALNVTPNELLGVEDKKSPA